MLIDVKGKVNNLALGPSHRLIPLFEAIVNSVQAINFEDKASILITAYRQTQQSLTDANELGQQRIDSFSITDFGEGFNQKNYNSFKTAESTLKSNLGCKGVGRFTWLKAFDKVNVDSTFVEGDKKRKLKFGFSISDVDFLNENIQDASENSTVQTTVSLEGMKDPYKKTVPIDLMDIATEIIEHCLIYFIEEKIASFEIRDNAGKSIDLLDVYDSFYSNDILVREYDIGSNHFRAHFFKNKKIKKQRQHKVYLCANSRSVSSYQLKKYHDNFPLIFEDVDGGRFNYAIYIISSYLDLYVNQERTAFSIASDNDLHSEDFPSIRDIIVEMIVYAKEIFEPYLEPIFIKHREKIQNLVNQKHYEYRHILKNRPKWINQIPVGLDDEALDIELHKLSRDYEIELKQEAAQIKKVQQESKNYDYASYKEALRKYTEDLNEIGKSSLAKYVVHRKAVIDVFRISLEINSNSKYALEDAVHDLIVPIRATSDDMSNHNLWLLDERMAYHKFLASDKTMSSSTNVDSAERPDVLVFNNPIVYGDDSSRTTTAIVVEFKRPMRDDYNMNDNPVDQVTGYISKLRKKDTVFNDKGREIYLNDKVPVYCYIICDLTPKIREILSVRNFKNLLDDEGYMFYNDNLNSIIEVISFDKLLNDAQDRNRILFKKLNLE